VDVAACMHDHARDADTAPVDSAPHAHGPVGMVIASVHLMEATMPKGKHLRGVSAAEQRQYEHILDDAIKSGRYGPRAKEVAARTVLKRHKARAHRRGE
jgi:hypothetical protein